MNSVSYKPIRERRLLHAWHALPGGWDRLLLLTSFCKEARGSEIVGLSTQPHLLSKNTKWRLPLSWIAVFNP